MYWGDEATFNVIINSTPNSNGYFLLCKSNAPDDAATNGYQVNNPIIFNTNSGGDSVVPVTFLFIQDTFVGLSSIAYFYEAFKNLTAYSNLNNEIDRLNFISNPDNKLNLTGNASAGFTLYHRYLNPI